MTDIRVLRPGEDAYENLEYACDIMFANSKNNFNYEVENTYFDFGQDWKWTTIICYDEGNNRSWQVLSPREWGEITEAQSLEEIDQYVLNKVMTDKYWLDK